jgi:hypothetical protein
MTARKEKPFRLSHLRSLNQVVVALGKTLRAAANGEIDPQLARTLIAGLSALREAIEAGRLQTTVDELARKVQVLAQMTQLRDVTPYADREPIIDTKAIRAN